MPIRGIINIPGDKSISHRALLISSIIPGQNYISNLSTGLDVRNTLQCLNDIGIKSYKKKDGIIIEGNTFNMSLSSLDCGNSGTTMRLLSGLLGGLNVSAVLTGDSSLSNRPMNRIIEPLSNMGIKINGDSGFPPITIEKTSQISSLKYKMRISSAQIKSALLLAGVCANKEVLICEKYHSRDHTEIMLKNIGYDISINNNEILFKPSNTEIKNINIDIPGDISSASFFIGAACMIPNSDLRINNVLINNTRMGFINILNKMGAGIIIHNKRNINGEEIGDIQVYYKPLYGVNINKEDIPLIIDELPILSIVATQAEGMTIISGAEELRYKETDRIKALVTNLKSMGVKAIDKKDGLIIEGPSILNKANIKSYDDHRIAMSFIIAGISSGSYNTIDNIDCIDSSFPEFLSILKKIIK